MGHHLSDCLDAEGEGRRALAAELTGTIQEEAERLNRLIANLLDMTRLEAGTIAPSAEPVDLGEVIGSALDHAQRFLAGHKVEIDLAKPLPLLWLDPVLLEQVLSTMPQSMRRRALRSD